MPSPPPAVEPAGPAAIAREPVDGPDARTLLAAYAHELQVRWDAPAVDDPTPGPPHDGLTPPTGLFLLARVDGAPAGCVGLRILGADTGEIKRMFVAPAHRGRGLARRLLTAVEDAARVEGLSRLRLDTMAQLVEARALYVASGYRDIARYNTNPYAAHWMEKALAPPTG